MMPEELTPRDRRRNDRRTDFVSLADYTIPELRKAIISSALLLLIFALFLYMVRDVLIAAVAGIVLGAYLLPLYRWLRARIRNETVAAIVTITLVTVPIVLLLIYSWREVTGAVEY